MTATQTVSTGSLAGVFIPDEQEAAVNIKDSFNAAWRRCDDGYSMIKGDSGLWTLIDAQDNALTQAELLAKPLIRGEFVNGGSPSYAGGAHW